MKMLGYKTHDEIYKSVKDSIVSNTPLANLSQASSLNGIARAFSKELSSLYDTIASIYSARFARTATAASLDALLDDRQIRRIVQFNTNVPCEAKILALRSKDGSPIISKLADQSKSYAVIGTGALITSSSDSTLSMVTTEPIVIGNKAKTVYIAARGQFKNAQVLPAGTFDKLNYSELPIFVGANLAGLEIVQATNIVGIRQVESNEQARQRYYNWTTQAANANDTALTTTMLSHPEVAYIKPHRYIRGTGSAEFVAVPIGKRLSKSALETIQAELQLRSSYGEDITVVQPDYVPVNMVVAVGNSGLVSRTTEAIERYVANIGLGGTISYTSITGALSAAGIYATVKELEVEGQKLLPGSSVTILENELFDLDVPLSETSNRARSPIIVTVG